MMMMKAAYLTSRPEIGHVHETLQVGDIEAPDPENLKHDEVLVQVKASCVNIDDMHMQVGSFSGGIFFLQAPIPTKDRVNVVGCDFCGIVKAVGPKVTKFNVGDCVCGINVQAFKQQGTWAEQVITKQESIIRTPETPKYTYAEWASLIMPTFVAVAMFNDAGIVEKEQDYDLRCLVVGASGGIGSFLVQLLSSQPNVRVTGVCGPTNVDLVKQLGAHEVYDYSQGTLTEQLERSKQRQFDRVFDLVGGLELEKEAYQHLLVSDGRFLTAVGPQRFVGATIMSWMDQIQYLNHIFIWPTLRRMFQRNTPTYHMATPMSLSADMFRFLETSGIKPVIDQLVPFEEKAVRDAVLLVQSHRAKGRVVLAIDPQGNSTAATTTEES